MIARYNMTYKYTLSAMSKNDRPMERRTVKRFFFIGMTVRRTFGNEAYLVRAVQLLLPFDEFFLLVGEVDELVQGLLVHVTVLLQLLVRLVQFLEQLQNKTMSTDESKHRVILSIVPIPFTT